MSSMHESNFVNSRQSAKAGWLGLPASKRKLLEEAIAQADLDGVLRMKMAVKLLVAKGKFESSDVKMFYEDMDLWIKEETNKVRGQPQDDYVLNPMEKAVLIKFARDLAD